MRNENKSKITFFLLGLSFIPDFSSGSCQGLSCSNTRSPTEAAFCAQSHFPVGSTGCWGTSALAPGSSSPHPFALILVSAELFLSHIHSSPYAAFHGVFLPLLKNAVTRFYDCLMGSAFVSGGSLLELTGLVLSDGKSFWDFLIKATFTGSMLPKSCRRSQRQGTRVKIGK